MSPPSPVSPQPDRADRPEPSSERLAALAALYGAGGDDLMDMAGPTHWPDLSAEEAGDTWAELAGWVGRLQDRFAHLDHHVIPRCWYRHNEHVEALTALRDHEQLSFAPSAPATAPLDWFRALRDIEALLRAWTSQLPCGATHEPRRPVNRADAEDLDAAVAADVTARRDAAIAAAVAHEP